MKLSYRKNRLTFLFIVASGWIAIGLLMVILYPDKFYAWFYLIIGLIYGIGYLAHLRKPYITITDGVITKRVPFSKSKYLEIKNIKQFRKFAGDYIFRTSEDELRIDTQLIEKNALSELDGFLANLGLSTETTEIQQL